MFELVDQSAVDTNKSVGKRSERAVLDTDQCHFVVTGRAGRRLERKNGMDVRSSQRQRRAAAGKSY